MDPDMVGDGDIEITRQQNRNYCIAEGFRRIAKESNCIGLMLRYRAQAEREYRRAVEDFDRLKALRHEMPNEPNVGLDEPEPEDVVPIEELNWELPHIRRRQEMEASKAIPNEPTTAVPNEANEPAPNEPTAVRDTGAADSSIPRLLTSSTPSTPQGFATDASASVNSSASESPSLDPFCVT
jgi:hypothetical protein